MKEIKFADGKVAFEPDSHEDSISAVTSESLLKSGWSREFLDVLWPANPPKPPEK
jgi:hypothetical protein